MNGARTNIHNRLCAQHQQQHISMHAHAQNGRAALVHLYKCREGDSEHKIYVQGVCALCRPSSRPMVEK